MPPVLSPAAPVELIHPFALPQDAESLVIRLLRSAPRPVTFLETGPLTVLAGALKRDPAIAPKIEQLVWMGGAVDVAGNVLPPFSPEWHDGTAEWNGKHRADVGPFRSSQPLDRPDRSLSPLTASDCPTPPVSCSLLGPS